MAWGKLERIWMGNYGWKRLLYPHTQNQEHAKLSGKADVPEEG